MLFRQICQHQDSRRSRGEYFIRINLKTFSRLISRTGVLQRTGIFNPDLEIVTESFQTRSYHVVQSVQQERVLDFSKTIRDFKTFFFKIKVLSKDYGATT